ncbi:hypothetical protein R1sor_019538 [Riccia sorocarpa]|uniref:E2 ubiquitin-conjugating enzyme n=1 Tax=Riccia sorocarpa TaxID=122646 RepID=A0ABD3IGZ1_9MARC
MQAARLATRLQRELRMLQSDPPPGVCAWPCDDSLSHLQAQIQGPEGTVYAKGVFKLEIHVPERYPFEPPSVRFKTPIYHPNIDSGGRICLDILNMPPKGAWKPSLNIPTVLASIGLLLSEPNPDDGLMGDITAEYKHNRPSFDMTATKWTQQHAMQEETVPRDHSGRNTDVQQIPSSSTVHSTLIATEKRQEGVAVPSQELQSSSESKTVAANNLLLKCSTGSNPKLNLGNKLSLEKGVRDSGEQGPNEEVLAATTKRPLESILNTMDTRQNAAEETQPSKKTFLEKKTTEKDADIRLNTRDGSHPPNRDKTISAVPSNDAGTPASSHALTSSLKKQTNFAERDIISAASRTSSAVPLTESDCSSKRSKLFTLSSKLSRKPSTDVSRLGEETADVQQGSLKDQACVASEVRRSGQASESPPESEERLTSAAAVASVVEGKKDEGDGSRGAQKNTPHQMSKIVQSRIQPSGKVSGPTKVDVIMMRLPDEPEARKTATGVPRPVRPELAKKPPIPAKPGANVIVLDSESDEEPPKGRSRLSLSRRKGLKRGELGLK